MALPELGVGCLDLEQAIAWALDKAQDVERVAGLLATQTEFQRLVRSMVTAPEFH